MKKFPITICLIMLLLLPASCSQEKTEESKVLCKINDYNLPLEDFQRQLAGELEFNSDFKLTQKAKRKFLEELIKKELLIQEAKSRKLDRKEKFVKAIERYWEATLIRDLMDAKNQEISQRIMVSEEEVKARYKEMEPSDVNYSRLDEMAAQIRESLKEDKKTRMLEEWINDLRKKADVTINEHLL